MYVVPNVKHEIRTQFCFLMIQCASRQVQHMDFHSFVNTHSVVVFSYTSAAFRQRKHSNVEMERQVNICTFNLSGQGTSSKTSPHLTSISIYYQLRRLTICPSTSQQIYLVYTVFFSKDNHAASRLYVVFDARM